MRKASVRPPSRLEMALLGLVFKSEGCTAYWLRRQFQSSPSSFFSGSAGAVYPAIERLATRGLVQARVETAGRRTSKHYSLTAAGRRVLADWLTPPVPAEDVVFTHDPVRTRIYYLDAMKPADRVRFVEDALRQARRRLTVVQAHCESEHKDRFDHLGELGVLYEAKARVEWLAHVLRSLSES